MRNSAIAASGLRKAYGDKIVLDGIDLDVPTGTVFSLLGPNGAGKTTTVNVLTTLMKADGGTARVAGTPAVLDRRTSPPPRSHARSCPVSAVPPARGSRRSARPPRPRSVPHRAEHPGARARPASPAPHHRPCRWRRAPPTRPRPAGRRSAYERFP